MKWKDKTDVLLLSWNWTAQWFYSIIQYNVAKSPFDQSDQMSDWLRASAVSIIFKIGSLMTWIANHRLLLNEICKVMRKADLQSRRQIFGVSLLQYSPQPHKHWTLYENKFWWRRTQVRNFLLINRLTNCTGIPQRYSSVYRY